MRLELGDPLGHRRGSDAQPARGKGEAAGFGDGNEGLHGDEPIHLFPDEK